MNKLYFKGVITATMLFFALYSSAQTDSSVKVIVIIAVPGCRKRA